MIPIILSFSISVSVFSIVLCLLSLKTIKDIKNSEAMLKSDYPNITDYLRTIYFVNNINGEYKIQNQGECIELLWYKDITNDCKIEFDMFFNNRDESLIDYKIRLIEL